MKGFVNLKYLRDGAIRYLIKLMIEVRITVLISFKLHLHSFNLFPRFPIDLRLANCQKHTDILKVPCMDIIYKSNANIEKFC